MAHSQQPYYQYQPNPPTYATPTTTLFPQKGPSSSLVIALATLLPLGAFLLILAGITLTGTVLGLAVATPLFVIFSPVLVPAAIIVGLAVAGFLTSGAYGVTALSSFTWLANYLRRSRLPEQLEYAKQRAQETMGQVCDSVKEARQAAQSKAQDAQNKTQVSGQKAQTKAQESGQEAQETEKKTGASAKAQEGKSAS